ncbi:MAG: hypothetical protein PVI86_06920 [Phycisphaerae bacterium]
MGLHFSQHLDAEELLEAAQPDGQDEWVRAVCRCLETRTTPDERIADALSQRNPERLCDTYDCTGEVRLLSSRLTGLRHCFEKCADTGVTLDHAAALGTPLNECELAGWRPRALPEGISALPSEENSAYTSSCSRPGVLCCNAHRLPEAHAALNEGRPVGYPTPICESVRRPRGSALSADGPRHLWAWE